MYGAPLTFNILLQIFSDVYAFTKNKNDATVNKNIENVNMNNGLSLISGVSINNRIINPRDQLLEILTNNFFKD